MEEYEEEYDTEETPEVIEGNPIAPAPYMGKVMNSPNFLMWTALVLLGIGFGAWFLITFTRARAAALAKVVMEDGE